VFRSSKTTGCGAGEHGGKLESIGIGSIKVFEHSKLQHKKVMGE
jgi:hypothetical protein